MADDGMLLNFAISDAPLTSQVKFKGGKWRDRVKAQNSVKKWKSKPQPTTEGQRQPVGGESLDRPTKKQKVEHEGRSESKKPAPSARPKTGHVTSRLFTSNPTPVTTFDETAAQVHEDEPAEPSNAPLAAEAENFLALGLSRRIAHHLSSKMDMKAPTAIQKNTIPQLIKEDCDAFLQAETGSGKTLAYLLPIVHRIMTLSVNEDGSTKETKLRRDSGLFAIILGPTRELCKQIATVLEKVLRCIPWLVSTTVIGGESKKSEKARLRKGVNILIATPGRLADHLSNTKVLNVGTVRWLVLDEGDRMMEMGFEDDIREIVGKIRQGPLQDTNAEGVKLSGRLPSRRVTILCSATMRMNVQKLGEISLEEAVHITAKTEDDNDTAETDAVFAAPSQLKQSYLIVPAKLRLVTLMALLKATFSRRGSVMKAIVFISCADSVDFHFDWMKSAKANEPSSPTAAVAPAAYITSPANPSVILHKLHGSLPQAVRSSTLHSFSICKEPCVLLTTDIASRGLDVPAVELVVEYDPAFAAADHVHRVGRTARAGRPGKAVLFLLPGCEEGYISMLHPTSPPKPDLYEAILQKGLATPVDLPGASSASSDTLSSQTEKQSWKDRAEGLQLHFEQRLLAKAADDEQESSEKTGAKAGKNGKPSHWFKQDSALLNSARNAFRSHIRAYATHVKEERAYFDMTQLHLGHVAKSFGLREAPGGIGAGVSRRTYKAGPGQQGSGGSAKRKADDSVDLDAGGVNDAAARKMQEKMKAVMNASSEFNIG